MATHTFKDRMVAFGRRFKLDSHHAIERVGLIIGAFAVTGGVLLASTGVSAFQANSESLASKALYTPSFTTSKTGLEGKVDGIFRNEDRDKVLVLMHFDPTAQISYNAADYRAWLLGSNAQLQTKPVETDGITGELHVFGSTGYLGMLLESKEPFDRQILNLTMRANAELKFDEDGQTAAGDDLADDQSFQKYDQWRVFVNAGASGVEHIPALDKAAFDPAQAYYDIVVSREEAAARKALDLKLLEMRTNLTQIGTYNTDLVTTKVDGLFLRPPGVPKNIDADEVTGQSAAESKDDTASLALETEYVVPGGFNFPWREGNVYDGYLDSIVPEGESYVSYLAAQQAAAQGSADEGETAESRISDMEWILSDGTDLRNDYGTTDDTMRPLITVMNNLSQAYLSYERSKAEYQGDLLLELVRLEVKLRDVQTNGTVNDKPKTLITLY